MTSSLFSDFRSGHRLFQRYLPEKQFLSSYHVLIDSLLSAVVIHGPDTSVLYFNAMAASLLGLTEDQRYGKHATDPSWSFLQENGDPMRLEDYPVHRVLASCEGFRSLVLGISRPDRTEPVWVVCSAHAVRDEKGHIVEVVVTFADITERKRAEEQLRELTGTLEEQINVRTEQLRTISAELTMTEERERRNLAQELHDNLSQLLALIKIKLISLGDGFPDPSINQILDLVDKADRSARLITQELSPLILHTLGLVPAMEALADAMERGYDLSVHLDIESERMLFADEIIAFLYRSARELLINVAKHAKVSGASLSFRCDEHRLRLSVSDCGRGFDSSNFHRGLSGQAGFGLRSVFERITTIGGEMEIESGPGMGTTITLTLPSAILAGEG